MSPVDLRIHHQPISTSCRETILRTRRGTCDPPCLSGKLPPVSTAARSRPRVCAARWCLRAPDLLARSVPPRGSPHGVGATQAKGSNDARRRRAASPFALPDLFAEGIVNTGDGAVIAPARHLSARDFAGSAVSWQLRQEQPVRSRYERAPTTSRRSAPRGLPLRRHLCGSAGTGSQILLAARHLRRIALACGAG